MWTARESTSKHSDSPAWGNYFPPQKGEKSSIYLAFKGSHRRQKWYKRFVRTKNYKPVGGAALLPAILNKGGVTANADWPVVTISCFHVYVGFAHEVIWTERVENCLEKFQILRFSKNFKMFLNCLFNSIWLGACGTYTGKQLLFCCLLEDCGSADSLTSCEPLPTTNVWFVDSILLCELLYSADTKEVIPLRKTRFIEVEAFVEAAVHSGQLNQTVEKLNMSACSLEWRLSLSRLLQMIFSRIGNTFFFFYSFVQTEI